MSNLKLANKLAQLKKPYDLITEKDHDFFNQVLKESDLWHKKRNKTYASLCLDAAERPIIPVSLFKKLNLNTSVDVKGTWLDSSGTSKQASNVFYDENSLKRIEQAMLGLFVANNMVSIVPSRFLLLSPDPRKSKQAGYATAFLKFTSCAPNLEIVFAVEADGSLNKQLAFDTLKRWGNDSQTIFIFGLTVYFEQLYQSLPKAITFKGDIKGITGGGWKGLTKNMEREEIIKGLKEKLQAPLLDIRDIFGLTEHPLHYLSCLEGNFHRPMYSRFYIMGLGDEKLAPLEKGLLRLQNPFFASLPAHDILTSDLAYWAKDCSCGNITPYFKYLGRVSSNENTCAYQVVK